MKLIITPEMGDSMYQVALKACAIASKLDIAVAFTYNGTEVQARPGQYAHEVGSAYDILVAAKHSRKQEE